MASARPFQFTGLPRLTRQQVALYESLCRTISERPFAPDFMPGLESLLGQIFRGGCRILKGDLRALARAELGPLTPAFGCFAVVGAAPSAAKIIVDMDPGLCALAVDRILGGSGDVPRMARPWTDVETGILSFVLLKVLAHVQGQMRTGRELSLVLDRVVSNLSEIVETLDANTGYHQLGYRLELGGRVGYGRILLPDSLITEHFTAAPNEHATTPQDLATMRQHLGAMGTVRTTFRIIAAHLDLSLDDIANVEAGDIIVLEDHKLQKTAEGIEGDVAVRLGTGRHARLTGRLHHEAGETRLEITDITSQAQFQEEPMADGDETSETQPDDNLAETEGLLRDIDAAVAVELGRIRMTTAQVVRLRRGQMLRLPRGPNDPVDLVVNGKLFAKGELIEVDGELGIRLTQISATD
jgi:type III secretion system YscQ/HrcQ family protein